MCVCMVQETEMKEEYIFSSLLMVDHGMLNTGTGLNVSECRMLQNMKTGGLRMMLGAATVAIIFFK